MLKTLRPELSDNPEYRSMIEREFEARYNLSHPNIVMINDFEEVPGIGMCIITDDVYGDSLRKLLDEGKLTDGHIAQLRTRLPAAMEYIQQNHIAHHPIRPETIIFTEKIGNLKLIDVGYDQRSALSHRVTSNDIESYGRIIREVLDKTGRHDPELKRIADRCLSTNPHRRFADVQSLNIALRGFSNRKLYTVIIVFLIAMVALLAWLSGHSISVNS